MNIATSKGHKRKPWELAAELIFVAWVIAINVLYYAQFKAAAISHLKRLLHR